MEMGKPREKLNLHEEEQINKVTLESSLIVSRKEEGSNILKEVTNGSHTQTERQKSINAQIGKKFKNKNMLKYKYHMPSNR